MHCGFVLLCHVCLQRYYEAADAAEEAMEREWAAAVTIQLVWRGYATRMQLKHQRDCARKMEEVYRQWNARKKAREAKIAALEQRRRDAYDGAATKLQSLWRGYRSRTDIFDFRSRSAYVCRSCLWFSCCLCGATAHCAPCTRSGSLDGWSVMLDIVSHTMVPSTHGVVWM